MDTLGRKIQIYRGALSNLPQLADGEPACTYDDISGSNIRQLWVGTDTGINQLIQAEQHIIDDLVSNDSDASLSARQGKILKDLIDAIGAGGSSVNVVDNLLSDSPVSALSARQGKILKGLVDSKLNITDIAPIQSELNSHISNQQIHVTQTKQDLWDNTSAIVSINKNKWDLAHQSNYVSSPDGRSIIVQGQTLNVGICTPLEMRSLHNVLGLGIGTSNYFIKAGDVGITVAIYCNLETTIPWIDNTGGLIYQVAENYDYAFKRFSSADENSWEPWTCIRATGVDVINLKHSVSNGKAQVANAITQKGIPTAADAEFATMATNISNLSSSKTGSGQIVQSGGYAYVNVTGLGFRPNAVIVVLQPSIGAVSGRGTHWEVTDGIAGSQVFLRPTASSDWDNFTSTFSKTEDGFSMGIGNGQLQGGFTYIAIK